MSPETAGESAGEAAGGAADAAGVGRQLGDYRSTLIASLNRILREWTSPDFLSAVAAREGIDLDAASIVVITVLSRRGPRRPSALATHLVTGASNVSKIIRRLTDAGLVERRPDPADARAQLVALTGPGRDTAEAFVRAGDGLVDELLDGWTERDRTEFVTLLGRFEQSTIALAGRLSSEGEPS